MNLVFNISLAGYLAALLLALAELFARSRSRLAGVTVITLGFGAVAQTVWLVQRWIAAGRAPFSNMFETLALFAWTVVVVYLALQWRRRMPVIGAAATALAVIALTAVNVVIVAFATYGGVHAMESNAFCGQVCHTTMEPQATAHAVWPHAEVSCTSCHVGPGAGSFVEAKMAGTRQLLHVMTNRVPRPVPPPSELIQPARATCEGCH